MEQQTNKNEDIIKGEHAQVDEPEQASETKHADAPEQADMPEQNDNSSQSTESKPATNRTVHFPSFIKRFGVWPINVGLFFFYSNIVSLFVLIIGLTIMSLTGVQEEKIITEKLGGLSVISTIITLGLTLIYSRRFYFSRY